MSIRIKKEGYWIELSNTYRELHNLLCIFLADEKFAKIIKGEKDPLWSLASFGELEITRILINSAIIGRIVNEQNDYFLNNDEFYCGKFTVNNSKIELKLKDAFDKIIHAKINGLIISKINKK